MVLQDDRTEQQKQTHLVLVIGTDRFLSGWGHAEGGSSYAAWACRPEDQREVENWVEGRSDMARVRVTHGAYRPNASHCAHCHIYVVNEGHAAITKSYDEGRTE